MSYKCQSLFVGYFKLPLNFNACCNTKSSFLMSLTVKSLIMMLYSLSAVHGILDYKMVALGKPFTCILSTPEIPWKVQSVFIFHKYISGKSGCAQIIIICKYILVTITSKICGKHGLISVFT